MNVRRVIVSFAFGLLVAIPMVVFAQATVDCPEPPPSTSPPSTPPADCVGQGCEVKINPIKFKPQIDIPGIPGFQGCHTVTSDTLGEYFRAIYVYFVSSVGAIAVAMIIFGGFRWITAAGNASKIQAAQETINSALIGLVLALTSFLILNTINPNLTRLRIPAVPAVDQLLQTTIYCKDGSLAAQNAGKTKECGKSVLYTDADGREKSCIATYVDPAIGAGVGLDAADHNIPIRTKDSLVCVYNKQTNGFEPVTIDKLCTNERYTSNNECDRADRQITSDRLSDGSPKPPLQFPGTAYQLACRKVERILGGDYCALNTLVSCPLDTQLKVSCNEAGGQDSPCWENGGPRYQCSSSPRASVGADSICCVEKNDSGSKKCQVEKPGRFSPFSEADYVAYQPAWCNDVSPGCSSKCWIMTVLYHPGR